MAKKPLEQPSPSRPAMAREPTTMGPEVLSVIPDEYLAAMGRVSAAWAILDFQLDMAICDFGQMLQLFGVAVTSQIFSTPSKLTALGDARSRNASASDQMAGQIRAKNSQLGPQAQPSST